jgi:tetratricopeptide (TPR) repeat protein
LKQAVKLETEDGDMYYELGIELSKIAQYQEAVTAFQKALDLDPDNYRAVEALDKAKEGAERIKVLQKRQEELLKKQEAAAKKANANGTNANATTVPTPPRTP